MRKIHLVESTMSGGRKEENTSGGIRVGTKINFREIFAKIRTKIIFFFCKKRTRKCENFAFCENGFYIFAKMKQTKFSRKFESENFVIFAKISRLFSKFSLNFCFRENRIMHFRPNSTVGGIYYVWGKGGGRLEKWPYLADKCRASRNNYKLGPFLTKTPRCLGFLVFHIL
jgi:hypothetical protein